MYSEVHATIGWGLAQPVKGDRKFRGCVLFAGLLPDLDVASYLFGSVAFSRYHHVWTHNLFFGLVVSGAACWICRGQRGKTFLFTQLAFSAHYFGDYFLTRMPLAAFWPISDAKFGYAGALPLGHPINHALVWVSLLAIALIAWRFKRTPMEVLSPELDKRLVNFFFRRRDTPCEICARPGNESCAECGHAVCGRHGSLGKEFKVICKDCGP